MVQTLGDDDRHLLELVVLLPGWEDEQFWTRVEEISGAKGARLEFNTALSNAASHRNCMSLSHLVLGTFGQPEHRGALARLIGTDLLLICSTNKSGVGDRWIEDATATAWRIWFRLSNAQDNDPVEALSWKWELPAPREG
ncbi:hypothetical protein OG939_36125 [Streptomyces sp. NBC_01685]|uniref:hypothetical protein n=1 Tax=Streptomyces sp. NBC_01685 TaxID=2975910 RepID=UPI002E2FE490|nr:hypothetical protein [Streptomyces sp. NBC_01685]